MNNIYEELRETIDKKHIILNANMKEYTSFKAGGKADLLIIPRNEEELVISLKTLKDSEFMIMGNGSNILVKDGGYRGAIIKMGEAFDKIEVEDEIMKIGAGALMSSVAREALSHGLSGFEFASGIPGSLGGAVFMNAGAYGGEIKNILKSITVVTREGNLKEIVADELELAYRHSKLQGTGEVVLNVTLKLDKGDKEEIKEKMKELTGQRNKKQPVSFPSAGSFFKRPEGHFAGKLIQEANLKGLMVGGAQVSTLHAGFIINKGNATARDILELMHLIQTAVMDKFHVKMEPEVRIIGED